MFYFTLAPSALELTSVRAAKPFAVLSLFVFLAISVNAQTTAFTYQGRLTESTLSTTGNYDFEFALFNGANGLEGTQNIPAVPVSSGIFTVSLDFGSAAFTGSELYLEIRVRRQGEVGYITLTPRQRITSVPYTIRSIAAGTAVTFTGGLSGDVTGTQAATVVSTVGGQSAANVAAAVIAVNSATPNNTPSTLVKRDATGNFSGGTLLSLVPSATEPTGANGMIYFNSTSLKFRCYEAGWRNCIQTSIPPAFEPLGGESAALITLKEQVRIQAVLIEALRKQACSSDPEAALCK